MQYILFLIALISHPTYMFIPNISIFIRLILGSCYMCINNSFWSLVPHIILSCLFNWFTLKEFYPLTLTLPQLHPHPHNSFLLFHLWVPSIDIKWLEDHYSRLIDVGGRSELIKNYHQDIQRHLKSGRSGRGTDPIISVEEQCNPMDWPSKGVGSHLLPCNHRNPLPDHGIHHHV